MLSYSIVINGASPPIRAVLFGRKGVFTEEVVVLIQRLFDDAGLLAVSSVATYHGHTAVLDDLVDRLHRARCGLAPDVSRHAAASGEHTRIPLLAINAMYRVEAPNVAWAVETEACDARIMEMVPEVVHSLDPLELALLDLKTEEGVDMLRGEVGDRNQTGRADDERCSSSAPLILQEVHRSDRRKKKRIP